MIGKERELKSRTKVMDLNVSRKMTFYGINQYSTLKKKKRWKMWLTSAEDFTRVGGTSM